MKTTVRTLCDLWEVVNVKDRTAIEIGPMRTEYKRIKSGTVFEVEIENVDDVTSIVTSEGSVFKELKEGKDFEILS